METYIETEDYKKYFEKGISYSQYFQSMIKEVENKVEGINSHYVPMNLQRSKRISKTIQLLNEVKEIFPFLKRNINWLVISEHWCGDASQILPVINTICETSRGKINLRIVYRDQNLDLINAHLTNGSMSIPKLLQLDDAFHLIGEFGPRPLEAQNLVLQMKLNPATASNYSERLHKWYADDKSISIQKDLVSLLKIALNLPQTI
jgi:hypothetical protein